MPSVDAEDLYLELTPGVYMLLFLSAKYRRKVREWNWRRSWDALLFFCSLCCPWETFAAKLTLTWTDTATSETGFRIERRTEGREDYQWIAALGADTVSYVDTTVETGKSYCYRVQAYNPGGMSDYSNEACATVSTLLLGFESPEPGQAVSGISTVRGWAFDSVAERNVRQVDLFVDGVAVGELPCCSPRGDVQAAFLQFPADNTANSGWGTGVNWGELTPGSHVVQVRVTSTSGEVLTSEARTVTVVRPGASSFVDMFSLAGASAQTSGQDLLLKMITIRDKATQQQTHVDLTFRWFTNLQSLGMTHALVASDAKISRPSLFARAASRAHEWWRARPLGPQSAYAASKIITLLESPDNGQSVFGVHVLHGWAFDDDPNVTVRTIRLVVDDVPLTTIPCCFGREDVAIVFSSNPNARNSGWGMTANYANLSAGLHTIGVQIESSAGVVFSTFRQVTVVKVEGFEYIDLVDFSDATAQIEGEDVVVSGVRIRDSASQQTKTVQLRLRWSLNSQSLGIVAVN